MTLLKRTMRHPATRPVAWLLIAALVALDLGVAPRPAAAQEQEARSAVVLDFESTAAGAALLGRTASAAMALKMTERLYVVRSRAEVNDAVGRLGLRQPYEADELRALAKELDAKQIVTGKVVSLQESAGPPAWAKVLLRIEVYDGATGDMVNGALVEGFAQGAAGGREDRDTLRNGAVERAVAKGLIQIESRTLLTAAVLQQQPGRNLVLINKGSRLGVVSGMLFDLYRVIVDPANPASTKQVKVGRVKVSEVSADDAMAQVLEAPQGIQSNDLLRQVFTLPEVAAGGDSRQATPGLSAPPASGKGGKGGFSGILMGVLGTVAGVGLLALLLSMQRNTNTDSPKVYTANAFLRQATPGSNPSVIFQWSDSDFTPARTAIGGYIIYRGQSDSFAAATADATGVVAGASQRSFSDDPIWRQINQTLNVRYTTQGSSSGSSGTSGTSTATTVDESIDIVIDHESPQPGVSYFYKVRRVGPAAVTAPPTLITAGNGTSGTSGTSGGLGGGTSTGLGRSRAANARARSAWLRARGRGLILTEGGHVLSVRRTRTVNGVKRQVTSIPADASYPTGASPQTDNDIPVTGDVGLSDASAAAGPVTYMVPPGLRSPANNNQAQLVDDVTFEYQGVLGATEYVLQLSTNVNFSPVIFQSQAIQDTSATVRSFRYNSSQAGFVKLAANTSYFWRVGAKSTYRSQPAPQPDGYVFSSIYTFTTADQPPSSP